MHQLKRLSGATASPDGEWVAYQLRSWDPKTGKTATNIEIVTRKGEQTTAVTPLKWGSADTSPVWAPDGKNLLYLSVANGVNQVWSVSTPNPNQVLQVTNYPVDVTNLKWSYKGNYLVFTADVYPDCNNLQCTADRDAEVAARGANSWRVYDKLFVRHWDTWATGKVSHVFVQFIRYDGNRITLSGDPLDTMFKMNAESPITPFGGAEQFDISPDGSEIAINLDIVDREQSWRTGWRIYTVKIQNGAVQTPHWLTSHISARTQNPLYSPDGSALAFLSMDRPGLESDRLHLEVYNRSSGKFFKITDTWDRSISDYSWIGSHSFFLAATDDGTDKLFTCANKPSAEVKKILADLFQQSAPQRVGNWSLYMFTRSSYTAPSDIWTFLFDGSASSLGKLTDVNKDALSKFSMSTPEIFHFPGSQGRTVQGWLFKPYGFDPNKKYPVAHLIHGGPEGAWESSWSWRWNPQLWASRGYAVVLINPPGSTGQGQAFTDAVRNDWGGDPYKDLMTGLDYILAKNPWMDSNNVHANGASYGGYMINWINGQTNRYRSLVCHDGVFDTMSMYYSTEELWFPESEYCPIAERGCKPWEKQYTEGFEKWNPRNYVQNWKTPTLVIQGGHDYRIPEAEGLSAFTALQRRGVPSKFLYFPLENHWVLNSANSVKWYSEVLGWMDKWSNNAAAQ